MKPLYFISAALIAVLLVSCSAKIQEETKQSYRDKNFTPQKLIEGEMAVLPVVAGSGIEGYRRPYGNAINHFAIDYRPAENMKVMDWSKTMGLINDNDLTSEYNEAIKNYRETSILDKNFLNDLAEILDLRYFLFNELGNFQKESDVEYSYLTGSVYESKYKGVNVFAQIWDSKSGDIVWEGIAKIHSKTNEFTQSSDHKVQQYTDRAAAGLVEKLYLKDIKTKWEK